MNADYIKLIENSNAAVHLGICAASGKLSHAYILHGTDCAAAEAVALRTVRSAFCSMLCNKCAACRKIIGGNLADLKIYPDGDRIKTEDILDLIASSAVRPLEGADKFFILRGADSMTPAAQNKLLKTLEEPPADTHIFICVQRLDSLLPTVLSRAVKLHVPSFTAEQIYNVCSERFSDVGDAELELAAAYSGGTLSRAELILTDSDFADVVRVAATVPERLMSSRDVLDAACSLTMRRVDPMFVLETLEIAYIRIFNAVKKGNEVFGYSVLAAATVFDLIRDAKTRVLQNCAFANVIDNLLFGILEVKMKCRL